MTGRSIAAFGAGGLLAFAAVRNRGSRVRLHVAGKRVVILGGGFGGLTAASTLAELAGDQVRITILDRRNYHLFTPMLYQVATCGVLPYDVAVPMRSFATARGIEFRKGSVQTVDFDRCIVACETGDIPYDFLVVALGSTTNYFGNTSARQHASPLKSLEDGLAIRNRVIDALERAAVTSDPDTRQRLLTFVVIGGGATGVETAGALADAVQHLIPHDYPSLSGARARVVIIEASSKLLGHMHQRMADKALREIRTAGVEVWLNTSAREIDAGRVEARGRSIEAETVIWATGVCAADVAGTLSTEHGSRGSVIVNECLQLPTHPNAFAIGDNAQASSGGRPVPPLAAAAVQEGRVAASNIVHLLRNERPVPFVYKDLGNVVSVGHRSGVAEVGGRVIGGVAGWLAWRVVHLARITSFRNKLATALDWTTGYFYDVDTARLDIDRYSHPA